MSFSSNRLRILTTLTAAVILLTPLGTYSLNRSAVAADPFRRNATDARTGQDGLDDGNTPAAKRDGQLREGTLIPPTVGRIVLIGRRWRFMPAVIDAGRTSQEGNLADVSQSPPPRGRGSSSAMARRDAVSAATPALRSSQRSQSSNATRSNARSHSGLPAMLISENLMLQRVAEAIGIDPSDDRWTITGEVAEFFDQNRLIILTAQRANSN